MSEPYEPESVDESQWDLCFCGCTRAEHDEQTGMCLYCFEDDCGGFEYDHDSTVIAAATYEELP
jgi:hypothetical protein